MTSPTTPGPSPRFEYEPPIIRYGSGSVADLSAELGRAELDRALVVCGQTVGSTSAVIDPVTAGLGDRLAGVFAETTPEKRLDTAFRARDRFEALDADVLVGLGGGSSLDIAKVASVLAATDRSRESIGEAFEETGTIEVPEGSLPPVVTVPTTLAGADISQGAGITAAPASGLVSAEIGGGVSHPSIMPHAAVVDAELVATTPRSVLAASAMNGFDKGIETLYAANATAITDGTAVRGLRELTSGLLALGDADEHRSGDSGEPYESLVRGLVCVQYGISRPDGTTLSIIHSFGHALSRTAAVQQGAAHAVVAPHVLEYLFEQVDASRGLLAEGLGVADADDPARAVVDRVATVRDALGLPSRLREVDGPDRTAFPEVAQSVLDDPFMANAPPDLDPSRQEIEAVLDAAW